MWFDFSPCGAIYLVQNDPAWLAFMVEIDTINVVNLDPDLHFCYPNP